MRVLLLDCDVNKRRRPYPNLALMKLSAYHKAMEDEVLLNWPLMGFDKAYASCVFTWNAKRANFPLDTIIGGSGLDLQRTLPDEVEHIMPDYDLYPGVDFSLGFTSRGCPRRCPWCIVPEKEGVITATARIYEFWNRKHHKIVLLDNNFLASPNWRQTMEDLLAERLNVDFNQGLDIRLINNENVQYLSRIKVRTLRFSFDDIALEKNIREGIRRLEEAGINSRRISFYVLYGFRDDDQAVERMKILGELNVEVYPMGYRGPNGKEPMRSVIFHDTIFWHGAYRNKLKFLRLVGRLPR